MAVQNFGHLCLGPLYTMYLDFTTYPTPLVSVLFCSSIPTFQMFFVLVPVLYCN